MCLLSACGGGFNPDLDALAKIPFEQNVSGQRFSILSQNDQLRFGNGILEGTGSIRFAEDLESFASNYNFELDFNLQEEGELSLVTHANRSLSNGVVVKFKRSDNVLSVYVTTAGITDDWSNFFSAIDANGRIKFSIDIHNNEPFTHLIFWDEITKTRLLNSAEDVDGVTGKGLGQEWGLILKNAVVSQTNKKPTRDKH